MVKRTKILEFYKIATENDDISGPIMAIGGAEDKTQHGKILKKFFELSGGRDCDITVIPWASDKKSAGENYKKLFEDFGAKKVYLLKNKSRKEAIDAFERSASVFLVGGDQKRLLDTLKDLNLTKEFVKLHKSGKTIGGTSAGASILGEHMPYWSDVEEKMIYYKGLNLITKSIIDQHFTQRNRLKRLEDGVHRFKDAVGFGIDEDTAIIFQHGKKPAKIGSGHVKII